MRDEIFGPILPLKKVKDIAEAIDFVNTRAKPLALYLFAGDKQVERRVAASTSSGGMTVNGILVQLMGADMPFGGVGDCGMGKYHGNTPSTRSATCAPSSCAARWSTPTCRTRR